MKFIISFVSFCLVFFIKDRFDLTKITSLTPRFWIPVVAGNATFCCRNMSKKRETAPDQRRTLLTRKRRPRRGERKREGRSQRTMWSKMLEVGENRTETGPVAGSLLLPGYGASCWIRNESFWTIALNNVCIIVARGPRLRNFYDSEEGRSD